MRDIIVIGASAGGVAPLQEISRNLPANIPAAVVLARHRTLRSCLPELLATTASIRVVPAANLMPIERGCFYIAPPDQQLCVENGLFQVDRRPKEGATSAQH